MRSFRFALSAVLGLAVIALAFALLAPSVASSLLQVKIMDECDPTTFNAVLGPGICTRTEGKTFQEFIAEFQADRAVGGWEFEPDSTGINAGEAVSGFNRGGEVHTFTEVAKFGNGFVEELSEPGQPTVQECQFPAVLRDFVPQGGTSAAKVLSPGVHRFQCCIHPWMRTVITVESH